MKRTSTFIRLAAVLLTIFAVAAGPASSAVGFSGGITRVSVSTQGEEGNGFSGNTALSVGKPCLSADGSVVVFNSAATNLLGSGNDTNNVSDVFVRRLNSGETLRASVTSAGLQANNESTESTISADGMYVAFTSKASNLAPTDTNNVSDVFIHNLQTGATILVSDAGGGVSANGASSSPSISADGRYVAFISRATNFGGLAGRDTVYVRDMQSDSITPASVDSSGVRANTGSANPSISADGRYVVFASAASNLVAGDANGKQDIFLHDMVGGSTVRVSVDAAGGDPDGVSNLPAITPGGRFVVFISAATDLVPGDANGIQDVFVRDLQANITSLVSVDSLGAQGDGDNVNWTPAISADGRYVIFDSLAANLVPGDSNLAADIFAHDLVGGSTWRLSVDSAGNEANGASTRPCLSANGGFVAFQSSASNLVPGDGNGTSDVFVTLFGSYTNRIYLPLILK